MPDLTPRPPLTEYVIFYPGAPGAYTTHPTLRDLADRLEISRRWNPDSPRLAYRAVTTYEPIDIEALLAGQVPEQRGKRART